MESPLARLLRAVEARCDPSDLAAAQRQSPEVAGIAAAAACAVQALAGAPEATDVLSILLQPDVQGCIPDAEHVASCKQRGGAAFARGQFKPAARLFSEAIRYCDETAAGDGGGASLAARLYANRALCLSKLQPPALQAALSDATAAAALDPRYPKALYRRACLLRDLARAGSGGGGSATGALSEALSDARRALELLREQGAAGSDAAEAEALVQELEGSVEAAGGGAEAVNGVHAEDEDEEEEGAAVADLAGLVRRAGAQLAVQEAPGEGRFLMAAAGGLSPASDVLRERPFAHALTKAGRRSVCATCMTPLAAAPAPCYCRRCPLPAYCSAACRDADPSHQPGGPECCLPWTVLLPPDAVAAVRLARRLRLEQGREAQQGGSESGESGGGWGAAAARQVAALGTHFADLPTGELAQLAALAAVAHATWQAAAAGAEPATPAAAVSAGDVLGALCRLQVNGLAVVPPQRRGSEDRRGLALYPVGALMNHSCRPNVSVRFQGCELVVRCLEHVAAGEPLLLSYGPQVGEMTRAQRQAMLQGQYFFACRCRACGSSGGDASAADAAAQLADAAPAGLKCPGGGGGGGARCEGAVLPACAVPAGLLHRYPLPPGSGACSACGAELTQERWQQVLPELQQAAEAHAHAAALLEQQDGQQQQRAEAAAAAAAAAQQAVRGLRQCLRLRQSHLHPFNALLGATHDSLARAWALVGGAEATADHLRHSLASLRHSYPPPSTAVAFQQQQLAQALRLAAAAAAASGSSGAAAAAERLLGEARQAEEEADAVLALHFGDAA